MQNFFALLTVVTQLLPLIHGAVYQVEKLFPMGGNGQLKLQMVDNIVQSAAKVTGLLDGQVSGISTMLGPIVSGIVGLANASGHFFSSGATVTDPLTAPVITDAMVAAAQSANVAPIEQAPSAQGG